MKKKLMFFATFLVASLVSCSMPRTPSTNMINTTPVKAYNDKVTQQSGLYVKITNPNMIRSGEQLLLVGSDTHTIQYFVGASYHYWVTTEGNELQHISDDYYYLNNTKAELVTFERVDSNNNFYLKLDHYVDNTSEGNGKEKSGYLVHEAYNNNGVTAFGDLYIRGNKDKPNANASRWHLEYDEEDGHMRITSLSNRLMVHKTGSGYMWNAFIASTHTEWDSDINLYRKVGVGDMTITPDTTNLVKREYIPGQSINLEGLSIQAKYQIGDTVYVTINSSYESHPEQFAPNYISYSAKSLWFTWCGLDCAYTIETEHDTSDEHLYFKPDYEIGDLRGEYLLGFSFQQTLDTPPITCVLKTSSISTNEASDAEFDAVCVFEENPICDTEYVQFNPAADHKRKEVTNNLVKIVCKPGATPDYVAYSIKIGDKLLCIENSYPDNSNPMEYEPFGKLKLGDLDFANTANTVEPNFNNYVIIGSGISRQLVFDRQTSKITTVIPGELESYHIPLHYYKLKMTDNLGFNEELNDFKDYFFEQTSDYDPSAINKDITLTKWGSIATAFDGLSLDSQSYLASLNYVHNQEEANSFEDLADRYDSIINTYYDVEGGFEDFMFRGLANTLQNKRNVNINCRYCSLDSDMGFKAEYKNSYTATIVPDAHYKCPENISITMGENELELNIDYSYNPLTGVINILKDVVIDDITINAEAEIAQYVIAFIGQDENGDEVVKYAYALGNYVLPSYSTIGFTSVPEGKQFKCWLVGGVSVDPAEAINIEEDTTVTAVYESVNPYARQIENNASTVPYLSYDYEKNDDVFTFSNVAIRFRTMINKTLWDQLAGDEENSNIRGYGVLFTTKEALSGTDLKNLYNEANDDDGVVRLFRSTGSTPTLLTPENNPTLVTELTYSWNLKVNLTTEDKFTIEYAAVAFIDTVDSGIIFVSQSITSVKNIAQEMLETDQYDETFEDGALDYLANL